MATIPATTPKLSDKQIREPLYQYVEENSPGRSRIFEEFEIASSRADLLVVTDGALTGYEIKSDLDSYQRLKTQVKDYNRYCDYCYAVVGSSHQKGVRTHIPETRGILAVSVDGGGKFNVELIRQATVNPKAALINKLSLLWRRELVRISHRNGLGKCSRMDKREIRRYLLKHIGSYKLMSELTEELFERDYTI